MAPVTSSLTPSTTPTSLVTGSANFPTVNAFQSVLRGGEAAFITKPNAGSGLIYSSYLGGGGFDAGYGIALDPAGNTYVVGDAGSSDFPPVSPMQPVGLVGENSDAFVAKIGQPPLCPPDVTDRLNVSRPGSFPS